MTILQIKDHLSAMLHGGSLKKVRNIYSAFGRAANNLLTEIHPTETIRTAGLTNTVHDNVYNYPLPSDFNEIIDLYPQDLRESSDKAGRKLSQFFDVRKAITNKTLVIEGSEGSKILRVNWKSHQPVTIHTMDDYDNNGTWEAYGTASGIEQDTITKYSGGGSVRFDLSATGDGIQCNDMSAVDLTDEDESGELFLWFYIKNSTDLANLTSITLQWGNTLTTQYWTGVAQTTQADGSAFKVGWNLVKFSWSAATETGTVDPTTIDSVKITFAISAAITDIRVDNIVCSNGRNFDIKYYSKYLFKNSAGTFLGKPTDDADTCILDNDAINIFLYMAFMECAHQIEGEESTADITYARNKLYGDPTALDIKGRNGLVTTYNSMYPSMVKKAIGSYGAVPYKTRIW